ncbi:MAG: FHA domain-containing protein [Thermoanaerobaculia bacterium]|nr:FHA domain-containing protein [Thermoanaerobaculia bacterium]
MQGNGWSRAGPDREGLTLPPGDVVEETAFDDGLFAKLDRQLGAGRCPHGWLEIEAAGQRLLCLVRDAAPVRAGLVVERAWRRLPLRELPARARQLEAARCRLVAGDETLTRMLAVHLCHEPELRSSTDLVDPARVLHALSEERREAVLAFQRGGVRSFLALDDGRPNRLYFGDPAEDPGPEEGDLTERLLAVIFRPGAPAGVLEVFRDLEVPADADAGAELADLAAVDRPPPPTTVVVTMGEGREVLHRPFTPPEVVIGRDPRCEIFLDNLAVSRRHARVAWSRGRFLVEDLESANGTRLNGTRVTSVPLGPTDRIEVGKFRLHLESQRPQPGMSETMLLTTVPRFSRLALAGDGQEAAVDRGVVIGRGQGVDLAARGWSVRPVHARVQPRADRVELVCFGSARVRVNGRPARRASLRVGDRIRVGRTELELVRREPAGWPSGDAIR